MNIYSKAIALASVLIAANCIASAQEAKLPTQWTNTAMQSEIPLSEYPRPQLQRNDWLCLNGHWDYRGGKNAPNALNPQTPASFDDKPDKILVPYCPESVLSGIQRKQEINIWYRRSFEVPEKWQNKHIIIHFGAVDHDATIQHVQFYFCKARCKRCFKDNVSYQRKI